MYQLSKIGHIRRKSDNAQIPRDERNTDYIQFLKWVEEGGVPDEPDPNEQLPWYMTNG